MGSESDRASQQSSPGRGSGRAEVMLTTAQPPNTVEHNNCIVSQYFRHRLNRVLHWLSKVEVKVVLFGSCRLTARSDDLLSLPDLTVLSPKEVLVLCARNLKQ